MNLSRSRPDFIVIRRHPDLPADFNTGDLDGKWFDRAGLPETVEPEDARRRGERAPLAVPTGRFETREDGAVAEVWEIKPEIAP